MDIMHKLDEIVKRYDNGLWGVIHDFDGKYKIVIDHNFYYKEQDKMEREIMALGSVKEINYHDIV